MSPRAFAPFAVAASGKGKGRGKRAGPRSGDRVATLNTPTREKHRPARMFLDKTIHIDAPPERVFELLSPARQPLWDKSLVRATLRDERPLGIGAVFDRVMRTLGFRFESAAETVAVEEGRLFAWRQVEGDFEANQGAFVLEQDARGTNLRLVAEVELPYVLPRLATEAEVQEGVSRAADDALFNLKALAEYRA